MPNGGSVWIKSLKSITQEQDELVCVVSTNAIKEHLESIKVSFHYWVDFSATSDYNPEFADTSITISEDQILDSTGNNFTVTYSLPIGAVWVRVWAQLKFKEKENKNQTGNNTTTEYYGGYPDGTVGWEGKSDWSAFKEWVVTDAGWVKLPPEPQYKVLEAGIDENGATYNVLRVWINDLRPTSIDGLNFANEVWFEVWDGYDHTETIKKRVWNGGDVNKFVTTSPLFDYVMTPGSEYFVRATSIRYGNGINPNFNDSSSISYPRTQVGDIVWTNWVPDSQDGLLSVPNGILWDDEGGPSICSVTTSSVKLKWKGLLGTHGFTYEILYSNNIDFLKTESNDIQTAETTSTSYIITGLEKGNTYFFKVRAKNDTGVGQASSIKSIVLGKAPSAPTTWSDTTTAKQGRKVRLYWTHNSEDSSIQKFAQIEIYKDGQIYETVTYDTDSMPENQGKDEEDKEITSSYLLDTTKFPSGAVITWRVRTAGVLMEADGKTPKYSPWSITRTVEIFAKPTLSLVADQILKAFPLTLKLQAKPPNQTPISYSISIYAKTAYINTNLYGEEYKVGKGEEIFNKYIDTNLQDLEVKIYPNEISLLGKDSELSNEPGQEYVIEATVAMSNGLTADAPPVTFSVGWESRMNGTISGTTTVDPDNLTARVSAQYLDRNTAQLIPNIELFIYRRTYDGNYLPLGGIDMLQNPSTAIGLPNNGGTVAFDPHPPLDYANYRVVAMSTETGEIDFTDLYPQKVGEIFAVIQWEESWPDYYQYYNGPGMIVQPNWTGTMLKLPWNLDVSDKWSPQTSAVEYIGREHPVGYYGTQVGSTSSWKLDVVKADREMIAKLRRLATYKGNVYVREPYGSGYWAMVKVSFSQNHTEVVVPVTLDITRVDGGL